MTLGHTLTNLFFKVILLKSAVLSLAKDSIEDVVVQIFDDENLVVSQPRSPVASAAARLQVTAATATTTATTVAVAKQKDSTFTING